MDLRQTDPTPLLGARQARSARFSESPGPARPAPRQSAGGWCK